MPKRMRQAVLHSVPFAYVEAVAAHSGGSFDARRAGNRI